MNHDIPVAQPERKRAKRIDSTTPRVETLIGESGVDGIGVPHHVSPRNSSTPAADKGAAHSRDGELMTLEQAAVAAGVSVRTLARYRKSGALEVTKVGRRVLCTFEAIQRALVRRSLQQLWREITDPSREGDRLSAWLGDIQALSETSPKYERPDLHRAYVTEALSRFGSFTVRDYQVGHLRSVAEGLAERGIQLESARLLNTFPESTMVIDALRGLHQRFGL